MADLIHCVADYLEFEDIRSYLVFEAYGEIVHERISQLGEKAVNVILGSVDHEQQMASVAALSVIEIWMKGSQSFKLQGNNRQIAKNILLRKALEDENEGTRRCAVDILGNLGEADVIPTLERVSQQDTSVATRRDGTIYYPVRERAKKGLEKLRAAGK